MAEDEFFADGGKHVFGGERAALFGDDGVEGALHEHVARLFEDLGIVFAVDGVDELVRLFYHIRADALVRLRPVPRAAAGRAEKAQDRDEVFIAEARAFEERDFADDDGAPRVVCTLPVCLVQLYLFRPAALHEEGVRFVAVQLAETQLHVAGDEVAVDVVHAQREGGAAFGEGIGGKRRPAHRGHARRRKGGVRFGHARIYARALRAAQDKLRGDVVRHAPVHAVGDVALLCGGEHGGGEFFVQRIETAAGRIERVERFKGDAERAHALRGGACARAKDDAHAAAEHAFRRGGEVCGVTPQAYDMDHVFSSGKDRAPARKTRRRER